MIRTDWTRAEITEIYNTPILELIYQAATVHRQHHDPQEVQVCTLLSVKTGGCPEDCAYCPQAARYHTNVKVHKLMEVDEVIDAAQRAKDSGSTRFCMGAAWREVRDNRDFDKVLEMVKGVNGMGMEVCCTLGMLTDSQLACTPTITIWIPAKNFTAILSAPAPTTTVWILWATFGRPEFRFVRVVLLVWANCRKTVLVCCSRWRPCLNIQNRCL